MSRKVPLKMFISETKLTQVRFAQKQKSMPLTDASLPGYVVPGQKIVSIPEWGRGNYMEYIAGFGTVVLKDGLYATLVGKLCLEPLKPSPRDARKDAPKIIYVRKAILGGTEFKQDIKNLSGRRNSTLLPQVGDVVYAKVKRLGVSQVHLEIMVLENLGWLLSDVGIGSQGSATGVARFPSGLTSDIGDLGCGYGAIIRLQDIRQTEREQIILQDNYRPGDIVRASVLSLGDSQNFYLSTARDDLGVVFAKSINGFDLRPIDWQTMYAPASGESERRKCANPFVTVDENMTQEPEIPKKH